MCGGAGLKKRLGAVLIILQAFGCAGAFAQDGDLSPNSTPDLPSEAKASQHSCQHAKSSDVFYDVYLPVTVNKVYIGEVFTRATPAGCVDVKLSEFKSLLLSKLTTAHVEALDAVTAAFVSVEHLNDLGLNINYNPETLTLKLNIIPDGIQQISLSGRDVNLNAFAEPAKFAVGTDIFIEPRYISRSSFGEQAGFAPLDAEVRGFISAGGFKNWSLIYSLDYRGDRQHRLQRGDLVLTRDVFDKALRFQAGDIRTSSAGFQSGLNVLGIGIERNYREIQPFRNLRPTGRSTFTLERDSQVTYEVNGVVSSTQNLAAGQYDIRDLPLATGANDIRVVITDEFGEREVGNYSTFVDTELLAKDTVLFGFNIGVPRNFTANTNFAPSYGDDLLALGFIEKGVATNLTLGGEFEANQDGGYIGGRLIKGLSSNVIAIEGGASSFQNSNLGISGVVRVSNRPQRVVGQIFNRFDAQLSYESKDFQRLGRRGQSESDIWQASLQSTHTYDHLTLGLNGAWGRRNGENTYNVGASVRMPIQSVNTSLNYQAVYSDRDKSFDHRLSLSLTKRFGRHVSASSRFSTGSRQAELQIRRSSTRSVGNWSGNASYRRSEEREDLSVDVSHILTRAEVDLSHDTQINTETNKVTSTDTRARIGVGFGYADGSLAIGRPVSNGFYILQPQKALVGHTVKSFRQGRELSGVADSNGPALVPLFGAYREQFFNYEVDELSHNLDIGPGQFSLFPSLNSGYNFKIGGDPSTLVLGYLVDMSDEPIALKTGTLKAISKDQDSAPIPFFTNSSGRFVAENVPSGRYEMRLNSEEFVFHELEVSVSTQGILKVGTIEYKAKSK